jgi:NTP pyrophosphatase (non-canonical NTP hydrolase)
MLTLDAYQHAAMQFRKPSATHMYALLGLSGEVGELQSLSAKAIRDGHKENHDDMFKKELGDILWFIAALADDYDLTLSDIAQANIDKLSGRQQRGTIGGSGDDR